MGFLERVAGGIVGGRELNPVRCEVQMGLRLFGWRRGCKLRHIFKFMFEKKRYDRLLFYARRSIARRP